MPDKVKITIEATRQQIAWMEAIDFYFLICGLKVFVVILLDYGVSP
jgi:hypothetical protein